MKWTTIILAVLAAGAIGLCVSRGDYALAVNIAIFWYLLLLGNDINGIEEKLSLLAISQMIDSGLVKVYDKDGNEVTPNKGVDNPHE